VPTHWVLTLSCPDRPGIVRAVAGLLADHGGNITESQQFGDPLSGLFFMRVQVTAYAPREVLEAAMTEVARGFAMTWNLDVHGRPVRTLVMGSTAAHCLNDLAFRQRSENLPVDLVAVVSNHTSLAPLADFYGIPFHHVPVTSATKAAAEARLLELVDELDVELVVLARYMQILSDDLCRRLAGRVINGVVWSYFALVPLVVIGWLLTAATITVPRALAAVVMVPVVAVPFLLLGLAIGYRLTSKAAIAVVQATLFPLAFAGGLFLPPEMFPSWLDAISKLLPSRAARDLAVQAVTGDPAYAGALLVILAWTALFAALAVLAYRRDEGRRFH